MPRLAANLSFLYTEYDFLDRFAAAAEDGFRGVECLFPYEHPAAQLAERLRAGGLEAVLINCPPGQPGERGLAALPGREDECRAGIEQALAYAQVLGCPRVHLLSGVAPAGADRDALRETLLGNLRYAAACAAEAGVTVTLEPINTRDIPAYVLNTQAEAVSLIEAVGSAHVGLQMDLYHCQIVEGDLTARLRRYFPYIRHMQIAGVPERQEPDAGELNLHYLFDLLDGLGYPGWVGCEYRPRAGTRAGLGWAAPWLGRPQWKSE
jgi:hydroxypyruvate isomerase